MLRKSQWFLAATALAVGAFLVTAARPAHAQVRIHLTGPVKTTLGTGIVVPPSSPITTPVTTPSPKPAVTTPAPVVIPSPKPTPAAVTPPKPAINSAPQGFSAGPGLLGANRVDLSYMVNRVGPDIIGVGGPSVQKVKAH